MYRAVSASVQLVPGVPPGTQSRRDMDKQNSDRPCATMLLGQGDHARRLVQNIVRVNKKTVV